MAHKQSLEALHWPMQDLNGNSEVSGGTVLLLISILLGWDGLRLVSYCLVIYYQNVKSYNAGILTALSN